MSPQALPARLCRALVALARTPRLLVACDYDGTLAPIVDDPNRAWARPDSVAALQALAALPDTTVAVVSGRARADLAALSGLGPEVVLVGSHGAEFGSGFAEDLAASARVLRASLQAELERLAADAAGVFLEAKPAGVAVHVRQVAPAVADRVLRAVADGPAAWDGVWVTEGKAVIELAVVPTDKGSALDALRRRCAASGAIFIGDDVTDEAAFTRLGGSDQGIKVGSGDTAAGYRVRSPVEVSVILALLAEQRQQPATS